MEIAWDHEYGGIVYGFSNELDSSTGALKICDSDKYFWVQAEAIAAAALLGELTGEEKYWRWYDKVWGYADLHFVDHTHGAWFCVLDRCNERQGGIIKSPAGKTDYHSMGACHDVLAVLRRQSSLISS
jgi:mannose/cellobiose epimerase-like protein (N-acyl-D-glucosamine 2-epimerase family)